MSINTHSRNFRISGRVAIGVASAAIAVTTLGAASASAATIRQLPSNASTGSQAIHPLSGGHESVALEAFPAGGKGSGSAKTCHSFTIKLQTQAKAGQAAANRGDDAGLLQSQQTVTALTDGALNAGCAVID